ncbi:sporulation protein YunB [Bacillus atrophaeus]|uniref:sporulation protein YunB n=1 Tax=Bacillus atrophaeus TaxID=1452 RepID=UPI00227F068A|nr:sporulation protein YunB [Bacillus atrophaeus]MCY8515269.1 sporulation protein YunB [Bacillus atrophaeus]MCY8517373.1 sporulation protein YunB [Bacillus atrophaeus]MCY8990246.1 sporulation protein YunB [Bacillus atrophaeus]MCY9110856.1 sporulation protein YunB [Bacillus atrophaeus]
MPRFRGPLRKRGPLPFRYVMLLTLVFFVISTTVSLWIINASIKPILMDIGEMETKRVAIEVIQASIEDYMSNRDNMKDMFEMNSDENGKLTTIDFNTQIVNSMKTKITKQLQSHLKEVETGEFTHSKKHGTGKDSGANENIMINIPLGQVTGNTILGNLGPKIPVRFSLIGDALTDVKTKIEPYGINNALIDISISVEIKVKVIIPFATKTSVVTNTIPVSIKAVQGEVPQFYNGSGGTGVTPSVQLPSSKEEDSGSSKNSKKSSE